MEEKRAATSTVVAKFEPQKQFVNARELHSIFGTTYRFNEWIERKISEYGFIENEDYFNVVNNPSSAKKFALLGLKSLSENDDNLQQLENDFILSNRNDQNDYILTLDMAKELAMVEKSEIGRKVRKYFIDIENRYRLAENKYKVFVESRQEQIEALHIERKKARKNFREARKVMNDIDNDILNVFSITFQNWQDEQRIQQLPFPEVN
ncbi:MAG: hypothetical protein EHM12_08070 [Dehalococcoidia bacterium]|nr:MAG: hypothetical protein EHM12_08070 [Dehalococcoidia bacterium]